MNFVCLLLIWKTVAATSRCLVCVGFEMKKLHNVLQNGLSEQLIEMQQICYLGLLL